MPGPSSPSSGCLFCPGTTEETLLARLHPVEHGLLVRAVADYFLGRVEV